MNCRLKSPPVGTIFFVAGHSGELNSKSVSLGALTKIRFFLLLLRGQGYHVVFIHSAPLMDGDKSLQLDRLTIDHDESIPRITVPRYRLKQAGRLKNIFDAKMVFEFAVKKFGKPELIWCYNCYAFEMNFARIASKKLGTNTILEYEDEIFARWSLLNPKPILDWLFRWRALSHVKFAICVNPRLSEWVHNHGIPALTIPGIVSEEILALPAISSKSSQILNVGYFGGLSRDKGGEFLIKLITKTALLQSPILYHVTGSGPLTRQFAELANKYPGYLSFYGVIDHHQYMSLVKKVSVMLNPHVRMTGVFPFKVIESIASGRILLSSPLYVKSTELSWLSDAIKIIKLDVDQWHSCLLDLKSSVSINDDKVNKVRLKLSQHFTPKSVSRKLKSHINSLVFPSSNFH